MSWLPEADSERDIFLRALRDYSEACEPPALTPGCPFAIDIGDGVRGCGEECLDLLAEYDAPPPQEEIPIAEGIVLRRRLRPRARRGPDKSTKPFDAGELHATDQALDLIDWSTTSLLVELRNLVGSLVSADAKGARDTRVDVVRDELVRRSVPFDDLLTDGLAGYAAFGAMLSGLIAHYFPDDPPWTDSVIQASVLRDLGLLSGTEGSTAQDDNTDASAVDIQEVLTALSRSPAVGRLATWMRSVGPEGVLLRQVPMTVEELEATEVDAKPVGSDAKWVLDRLTCTYMEEWSTESLRREWHWRHSQRHPPVPPRVMRERVIDEMALACEMADRLSSMDEGGGSPTPDFIALAVRFLESGERLVAASIFEHARTSDTGEVQHVHNQGFCLIVDHPEEALRLLREANANGYWPPSINAADQAIALASLGRHEEARELARKAGLALAELPVGYGAHLWDLSLIDGEPPQLVHVRVHEYVNNLMDRLAVADR